MHLRKGRQGAVIGCNTGMDMNPADGILQIGKIPNTLLYELVIRKMTPNNGRALLPAGIGEDFGALDFGEEACVVAGDPVTGATKFTGKTAVHVACNDIATCGVKPIAILTTLLLPPGTTRAELGALADEIAQTAKALGVSVIGGHTEVTDAVTRTVISVTAIGAAKKNAYITTGGAGAGDTLIMTKGAALEGAALIAAEKEAELAARFGADFVERAKRLSDDISVVADGVAAGGAGAKAMHDATEGGVYGAAWEMAEASGRGVEIYREMIYVPDEAREICDYFGIDAYRLISSGCMLIATDSPDKMISTLQGAGIPAVAIGKFLADPAERKICCGNAVIPLEQPGPDELYKVINQNSV